MSSPPIIPPNTLGVNPTQGYSLLELWALISSRLFPFCTQSVSFKYCSDNTLTWNHVTLDGGMTQFLPYDSPLLVSQLNSTMQFLRKHPSWYYSLSGYCLLGKSHMIVTPLLVNLLQKTTQGYGQTNSTFLVVHSSIVSLWIFLIAAIVGLHFSNQ